MLFSYLKTGAIVVLASSSFYLLFNNNQLQQTIIDKNALAQSQAESIAIMSLVKKTDDLEIKKLINELANQQVLAQQYQNKLTELAQVKTQFTRNLSALEQSNEKIKNWLDIEHSSDINRLLNNTQANN